MATKNLITPISANIAIAQERPGGGLTATPSFFRTLTNIIAALNGTATSGVGKVTLGNGVSISSAAGSPQGKVAGALGDLYLNSNGGAGQTLFVKESNGGLTTGWRAV